MLYGNEICDTSRATGSNCDAGQHRPLCRGGRDDRAHPGSRCAEYIVSCPLLHFDQPGRSHRGCAPHPRVALRSLAETEVGRRTSGCPLASRLSFSLRLVRAAGLVWIYFANGWFYPLQCLGLLSRSLSPAGVIFPPSAAHRIQLSEVPFPRATPPYSFHLSASRPEVR